MAKARDVDGISGAMPYRAAAARIVQVRGDELFEHLEGVLDTRDIERVHAARVATRRLRAVLEIFAVCFPQDEHRAVLREVKALADALGERRDPDVLVEGLERFARRATDADRAGVERLVGRIRGAQERANVALGEAVEHVEACGLRARIHELVRAAAPPEPEDAAVAGAPPALPAAGTTARLHPVARDVDDLPSAGAA